ncbi:MAG TPA: roadblock/LC7 domain-containing protein [Longimicrobiaceae bacterium]|nr:roadblock/LC7 domain-containing protein [Longimicrobiaceae bacterium]
MSSLDEVLSSIQDHPGVDHVLMLGRDGLLIQHLGHADALDTETTSAVVPEIARASEQLGHAGDMRGFSTAVLEFAGHVAIVVPVSDDLILAVLLRSDVGFAPLLRELRTGRERFAALL